MTLVHSLSPENIEVTIVITTYNNGQYLEKCLNSVFKQSHQNCEIIIVNDGSTDNSDEIIKKCIDNKNNVKYFFQENAGVSVARNYGIDNAHGEYIMFVDGDDYLDHDIVEKLLSHVDKGTDVVCSCCHAFLEESFDDHFFDGSYKMSSLNEKERLFAQLMNGNYGKPYGKGATAIGVPWGKLYRLSFLNENGIRFDPDLRRMQDNVFNMYVFYYAKAVFYLDEPLYNYRLNHISSKRTLYSLDVWEKILTRRESFFTIHPELKRGEIEDAFKYEKCVALAASALYVVKNNNYLEARKKLRELRNNKLFDYDYDLGFISEHTKIAIIGMLLKLKLYSLVVVGMRLV